MVAKTDLEEVRVDERYDGERVVHVDHLRVPTTQARMAVAMIERWGMVMAMPDGEDAAGRQKLRLMTPDELVERACDVAELAFAEFERVGWLLDVPPRDKPKGKGKGKGKPEWDPEA